MVRLSSSAVAAPAPRAGNVQSAVAASVLSVQVQSPAANSPSSAKRMKLLNFWLLTAIDGAAPPGGAEKVSPAGSTIVASRTDAAASPTLLTCMAMVGLVSGISRKSSGAFARERMAAAVVPPVPVSVPVPPAPPVPPVPPVPVSVPVPPAPPVPPVPPVPVSVPVPPAPPVPPVPPVPVSVPVPPAPPVPPVPPVPASLPVPPAPPVPPVPPVPVSVPVPPAPPVPPVPPVPVSVPVPPAPPDAPVPPVPPVQRSPRQYRRCHRCSHRRRPRRRLNRVAQLATLVRQATVKLAAHLAAEGATLLGVAWGSA